MRYAFYLKTHSNARYQQSMVRLAEKELQCLLFAKGMDFHAVHLQEIAGETFLVAQLPDEISPPDWRAISRASCVSFAAEMTDDGLLRPLVRPMPQAVVEPDMPHILKYKGKTNPDFTLLMLHCARAASAFTDTEETLTVLDPMCSRGTTLFCALSEGYHAIGLEPDGKANAEGQQFTEHYLEWHRLKYRKTGQSRTLRAGGAVRMNEYHIARDAAAMKENHQQTLQWLETDAVFADQVLKPGVPQLLVCDLPYGVQHAPRNGKKAIGLEEMLKGVLPACAGVLANGGACAFSFNINTLRRQTLIRLLTESGLIPLTEPPFDDFEHWVEQAVTRDLVVARKP